MTTSRPEFHLRRVLADGSSGPLEVYQVHELPGHAQMSRRGFMGTGVALASVLAAIGGCEPAGPSSRRAGTSESSRSGAAPGGSGSPQDRPGSGGDPGSSTDQPPPPTYDPPPPTYQPPPAGGPPPSMPAPGGDGEYEICTCDTICVCIPVCQAHRLLHPDPLVRTLAEELLLLMGAREFAYMRWAAERAQAALAAAIRRLMAAIQGGARPDPGRWPDARACAAYLESPDEVVRIMAAQMLRLRQLRDGMGMAAEVEARVDGLLDEARRRPWFVRAGEPM